MLLTDWLKYLLYWLSLPALAILIVILVWRRLHKEFPFFVSYIAATLLVTIARFVTVNAVSKLTWVYLWWISDTILSIFALLAVYEVFVRRLFANFYKVRFYRLLFPTAAIIISILGLFSLTLFQKSWFVFSVIAQALLFIRVALLVFFVVLMLLMGREWTRYELGIAFGFGAAYAPSFFTSAMWSRKHYGAWLTNLISIGWNLACLIWIMAFGKRMPAEAPNSSVTLKPELLHEARTWEDALKDWLTLRKR